MENQTKNFIQGARYSKAPDNAPKWLLGKISIKADEFIQYLQTNQSNGWLNIDIKESSKGNIYLELNDFKPNLDKPEPNKEKVLNL
jgi:hypothetical protein